MVVENGKGLGGEGDSIVKGRDKLAGESSAF